MSRLALATWLAALCAAAFATWRLWSTMLEVGWFSFCPASFVPVPTVWEQFVLALRADAQLVLWLAMCWAVPVLVVLVGMAQWRSAVAGRRVAAVLALSAILGSLTWLYVDPEYCGEVPVLSGHWFANVGSRLGSSTSVGFLVAAVLVLMAGQVMGPADEKPVVSAWAVVRWVVAVLVGYGCVAVFLVVGGIMTRDWLEVGLLIRPLIWLGVIPAPGNPWPALVSAVMVLFLLSLRTPGTWCRLRRRLRATF
ncbi:hypothetical protein [Nonomuraea insulae]|uniref:DUF998 domain-containing protein n=1 Tax=Nonomuraea insulae TaxID=1616787 RepID=A0ABW1CKN5_9ACTN